MTIILIFDLNFYTFLNKAGITSVLKIERTKIGYIVSRDII